MILLFVPFLLKVKSIMILYQLSMNFLVISRILSLWVKPLPGICGPTSYLVLDYKSLRLCLNTHLLIGTASFHHETAQHIVLDLSQLTLRDFEHPYDVIALESILPSRCWLSSSSRSKTCLAHPFSYDFFYFSCSKSGGVTRSAWFGFLKN